MIEIRKILAPTDFSGHAAKAMRYACGLAERLGSELHLLHVLSEIVPAGPDPLFAPVLPPEYYREMEGQSRITLAQSIKPSWGHPKGFVAEVRWGGPVEGIVEYAREQKIDLIVIATHGRSGLSLALLGSVAERIMREAPCPVLSIRDRDGPPASGHVTGGRAHRPAPPPYCRRSLGERDFVMPPVQTDRAKDEQRWAHDALALKATWVWWLILLTNMVIFAWGLRAVDAHSVVPLSCVWLGAFSCCMIFHLESVKRALVLKTEVEELRRALEERTTPHP